MKDYGKKVCMSCGIEFSASMHNQLYCGSQQVPGTCAFIHKVKLTKEFQFKNKPAPLIANCARCNIEFKPYITTQHLCGSRTYKTGCVWEKFKEDNTRRKIQSEAEKRWLKTTTIGNDKECIKCHNKFTPRTGRQKMCGDRGLGTGCAGLKHRTDKHKGGKYYNKETSRNYRLLSAFGISLEEYNLKLLEQGGHCEICPKTPEENGISLAVDHDHSTGKVRGLLCSNCNRCLGLLRDSTDTLQSAINYLNKWK